MQALYQWQLNHLPAREINRQFLESDESAGVDVEYFTELLTGCIDSNEQINLTITPFVDRPIEQLDPVESAILMIGVFELQNRMDVPFRVVINEAVDLCKRFGATDAHKYINAVLDRAARELRKVERE
jgi:N utilization substance protein B